MTTVEQVAPIDPAATAPMPVASRLIGAISVGVALLSATVTFLVLAGMTPIDPVQSVVVTLLAVNAGTGVLLLAIIGLEVWVVIQARRRGHAGSRLHVQIVSLFAVIAAVPTVLVDGQNPSWSPNSRTLIYNHGSPGRQTLSVLDVFTKQYKDCHRMLATGSNSQPAWAR